MIVVETILREIFAQIPDMTDSNGNTFEVKYHWGDQDDMNLYMSQEAGNKTPLIWLVQGDKDEMEAGDVERNIKLILAKSSTHKTSMNPKVWDTEFAEVLNPLLDNVIKSLERSGVTQVQGRKYSVYREANYSEYERTASGGKTETKTIDHWNVITLECMLLLNENAQCINTINFY